MDLTGETDEGTCRIEGGSDGEWIEATYRENWWIRKIIEDDTGEAYAEMVEPFYLKCRACHRHHGPMFWSAGSPTCPACEQKLDYNIPRAFEMLFDEVP